MDIPEALKQLEDLPTTAAIADELASMSITAQRSQPDSCAIARYLWKATGEEVAISVKRHWVGPDYVPAGIIATADFRTDHALWTSYTMPRIARFVVEFDRGEYPKLDVEQADCTVESWD
jgi:hypothetical protein